ncbi:odorant receptor 13a-like [Aphidius gifuensis]|uniref:Odorant receptor n=1 Tax=Aphidius gifuensis TaxID=684658 RepID=A0A3Q9EL12_APHGI|nr:odorant receptor 13a-like [Aphidius gifuensis]AZQ24900.1 odorant receptor [Aphidius gifuensis]
MSRNNIANLKSSYRWTKLNFDIVGSWPSSSSNIGQFRAFINSVLITTLILIPRFSALYYIKNYLDGVVFNASGNLIYIVSIIKMFVIFKNQKVLAKILDDILSEWNNSLENSNYHVVEKYANISKNISILSLLISWTVCVMGCLAQRYSNIEIDDSVERHPRLAEDMFWVSYFPYDIHATKIIFALHWTLQAYASVVGATIYVAFDCYCCFLILHLTGQLTILQIDLRNIHLKYKSKNYNTNNLQSKLKKIVKRHHELIQLSVTLEKCFNKVLLLQLLTCCLTFASQGYLMIGKLIRGDMTFFQTEFAVAYTTYTVVHFYFLCYAGESLIQTSMKIGFAAYEAEWYDLSTNEGKLLMFVTLNSMRSLKITTGKFAILSYELFITVIRTSLSYLSVLLAAKDSKS